MKSLFLSAFICFSSGAFSQTKTFSSLSKYEKRWAFFHPFATFKIKKHQKEMYATYEEVKKNNLLDQYASGGKLDAFRHVFAMAYFSRYVCVRKLRKLGKAHEKGNYLNFKKGVLEEGELADSVSTVMDLKNNELGFLLGKTLKKIPIEELKQKIIEVIHSGGALIIKRNATGQYVDCEENILALEEMKGKWHSKKCLVPSNH